MSNEIDLGENAAWAAVMRRDRAYDGRFVTGVLSTGIYCRPSCAARHPSRKNVRFFASGTEARANGLRACKRCLPDDVGRDEAAVLAVIDAIKSDGSRSTLDHLAQLTGYSPTHLQRVFKRATGLSPAVYARALREERARDALVRTGSQGGRVSDAVYDAGYEAPSRFYAAMEGKLGMQASDWSKGGAGITVHWVVTQTSLGAMLVGATDKGVCCLSFDEGEAELRARFPKADLVKGGDDFAQLLTQIVAAVEDPSLDNAHIPLDVKGTAFQQRCWQALRDIPAGETRSYGEQAAMLGNPKASRAVGSANGANNIAVLIPCHRVVQADGSIGGYAYGPDIKRELLKREAQ